MCTFLTSNASASPRQYLTPHLCLYKDLRPDSSKTGCRRDRSAVKSFHHFLNKYYFYFHPWKNHIGTWIFLRWEKPPFDFIFSPITPSQWDALGWLSEWNSASEKCASMRVFTLSTFHLFTQIARGATSLAKILLNLYFIYVYCHVRVPCCTFRIWHPCLKSSFQLLPNVLRSHSLSYVREHQLVSKLYYNSFAFTNSELRKWNKFLWNTN